MQCTNIKVNKEKYLTKMYHCTTIKIIVVHAVVQVKLLIINPNIPFVPLYHNNFIYIICERKKHAHVYIGNYCGTVVQSGLRDCFYYQKGVPQ
jgi:hypothetical protein